MREGVPERKADQGDILLWAGGAVLTLVTVAWLLVARPWAPPPVWIEEPDSRPGPQLPPAAVGSSSSPGRTAAEDEFGNPLRMAELAYDAGMLLEPEAYSAWALYDRALQQDPDNPLALAGLTRVADDLVTRGRIANEQGRIDDARLMVRRVLALLPDHGGAQALELIIEAAEARIRTAREEEESRPTAPSAPATAGTDMPDPTDGSSADQVDGTGQPEPNMADTTPAIEEIAAEFAAALTDNRLLAPPNDSARFHHSRLLVSAPQDERTLEAGRRLFEVLMQRADEAVVLLDGDAAGRWLDEADQLDVDARAVSALREELIERLVIAESARPVPVSSLTLLDYAAPTYPTRALERLIEGWVDLEFTVDQEGRPRDVVVTDGSHDSYFRHEALRALEQWRFQPREFMGRPISQRSYTRVRFAIEE